MAANYGLLNQLWNKKAKQQGPAVFGSYRPQMDAPSAPRTQMQPGMAAFEIYRALRNGNEDQIATVLANLYEQK